LAFGQDTRKSEAQQSPHPASITKFLPCDIPAGHN
jgi:hypothetical protein